MDDPNDTDKAFLTAKVEALLSHAFESADRAKGDQLDPEDQAILAAIGEMQPEEMEGDETEEQDGGEEQEETSPIPAAQPA